MRVADILLQFPNIPGLTVLGFLGILFFVGGLILILSGFGIIEVQQLTVIRQGRNTWLSGLIVLAIGIAFLVPDISKVVESFKQYKSGSVIMPSDSTIAEKCVNNEEEVVYFDDHPDTTTHSLQLVNMLACGSHKNPKIDGIITFIFTLKNVSDKEVKIQETFIAARDPQDRNLDFGYSNQNITIVPQETILTKANKILDIEGNWEFWPCYILEGMDSDENYCPPRWRSFPVKVENAD